MHSAILIKFHLSGEQSGSELRQGYTGGRCQSFNLGTTSPYRGSSVIPHTRGRAQSESTVSRIMQTYTGMDDYEGSTYGHLSFEKG